jgi:hypothetical protein
MVGDPTAHTRSNTPENPEGYKVPLLTQFLAILVHSLHILWIVFVFATPFIRTGFKLLPWPLPLDRFWGVLHMLVMSFVLVQYWMDWPCLLTVMEASLRNQEPTVFLAGPFEQSGLIAGLALGWLIAGILCPWASQNLSNQLKRMTS